MKNFTEWLGERDPEYLAEMDRRDFLRTATAGMAGLLGTNALAADAGSEEGPARPTTEVNAIDKDEPNSTPVTIRFRSTGNTLYDRRIAVRVVQNDGVNVLKRRIEDFLNNRSDVSYRFQLTDPRTQREITITNLDPYLRYPQKNKRNNTNAGQRVSLEAEYRIIYIGPDGRVINNITKWLNNNPLPTQPAAPGAKPVEGPGAAPRSAPKLGKPDVGVGAPPSGPMGGGVKPSMR